MFSLPNRHSQTLKHLSSEQEKYFAGNCWSDPSEQRPIGALLDFLLIYEPERHKDTDMEQETFSQMVETATWLGSNIGKSVAKATEIDTGESKGRAKGAIHRLRKTRTVGDFMNEIARLQFRYGLDLPKDVLNGGTLTPGTFETFRGFCVVAALNAFLYRTKSSSGDSSKNS